jgi:hypothetical protein
MLNIKFDNNLRLEINVKENNKLSDEEKNNILLNMLHLN